MKYRRKPVIVEAEQFRLDKSPWPEGVSEIYPGWIELAKNAETPRRFNFMGAVVFTIRPGDWVVTNPDGARYVVHLCDFFEYYEPVTEKEAVDAK